MNQKMLMYLKKLKLLMTLLNLKNLMFLT